MTGRLAPLLRAHRHLVIVVLLAFVLRGALLVVAFRHEERAVLPDTHLYVEAAQSLLHTGSYPASSLRTPVYPLFIAFVYGVAGEHTQGIVAAQVLVSTASVLLTYWLGMRLLSRPAAWGAALLMAVSVESITHTFFVLTESLFTLLLLASVLALVKYRTQQSTGWLAISAVMMAAATLCRPITVYFPAVAVALIACGPRPNWRDRVRAALVYLLAFTAVLGPWVVRNYVVVGLPTVSTITSVNLLDYNAASLVASLNGSSEEDVRRDLEARVGVALSERGWPDTEANRSTVQAELARRILLGHPLRYLFLHAARDLNSLLPDVTGPAEILGVTVGGRGTLGVLNQRGLAAAVRHYFGPNAGLLWWLLPVMALLGATYVAGGVGLIVLYRQRAWFPLGVLLLPVLYLLAIPGAPSLPRFRVPAMPYLCLLAGLGLSVVWRRGFAAERESTA